MVSLDLDQSGGYQTLQDFLVARQILVLLFKLNQGSPFKNGAFLKSQFLAVKRQTKKGLKKCEMEECHLCQLTLGF